MKHQSKKLYPEAYTAWKANNSQENTAALMRAINPVITSAVKSYAGGDKRNLTRARILAIKALPSYDPSKGVQLNTFLMSKLRALTRTTRQRQNMIHLPENVYFNRMALKDARQEHFQRYDTEPTNTQLADMTGLTERQIKKADAYSPAVSGSAFNSEKGDSMVDAPRDYYDVWVDYVYHDMDDKDRKIFEGVSGYKGAKIKPKHVLAKELKMTPAAVSYRIGNITKKLEEMPNDEIG